MLRTLKTLLKQDKERYKVPRRVQDVVPIRRIWNDGIFLVGNKYTKMYRFSDINYLVASREDKESMFLTYSELLNSLACDLEILIHRDALLLKSHLVVIYHIVKLCIDHRLWDYN